MNVEKIKMKFFKKFGMRRIASQQKKLCYFQTVTELESTHILLEPLEFLA